MSGVQRLFGAPVLLAWWPAAAGPPVPLEICETLDAPPFLAWSNVMAEALKYTSRGRTVRIFVPESPALSIPAGGWDLTGIVLMPVRVTP